MYRMLIICICIKLFTWSVWWYSRAFPSILSICCWLSSTTWSLHFIVWQHAQGKMWPYFCSPLNFLFPLALCSSFLHFVRALNSSAFSSFLFGVVCWSLTGVEIFVKCSTTVSNCCRKGDMEKGWLQCHKEGYIQVYLMCNVYFAMLPVMICTIFSVERTHILLILSVCIHFNKFKYICNHD